MKKIALYSLSVAFLATGMISCGKTTRGKMINDWKVVSSTSENTILNTSGDKTTSIETITDNAVTTKFVHFFAAGDSTQTGSSVGKVNENSWSIRKDGTWTWKREVDYSGNGTGTKYITENSGTWSFIEKNKEDGFKKNERVMFNVLSYKLTQVFTSTGNPALTDSSTETYSAGDQVMIFTVKDSNKKLLEMEMESDSRFKGTNMNTQYIDKLSVRLQ